MKIMHLYVNGTSAATSYLFQVGELGVRVKTAAAVGVGSNVVMGGHFA